MRNSLCFNVLNDSNSVLSRCMCVRGRGVGLSQYFDGGVPVWLKLLHSIHLKAKSEKHIHNMTTIFYFHDSMIVFHSMTSLNPAKHFYPTHWLQTDKPY